jgi:hypothetical protein
MSRSQAARVPPVLRKLLCPYRRPRTRRGAHGAPVVAGAAHRKTVQPPAVTRLNAASRLMLTPL